MLSKQNLKTSCDPIELDSKHLSKNLKLWYILENSPKWKIESILDLYLFNIFAISVVSPLRYFIFLLIIWFFFEPDE